MSFAKSFACLSLAVLALAPQFAHAEPAVVPVAQVGSHESGCVIINVGAGHFNAGGWLVIAPENAGATQMLQLAQAAIITKSNVWVNRETRPNNSCANYWGVADVATDIRLVK